MKYKKGDTQHGSQRNKKKERIFEEGNHGNRAFNEFCKYECECKFDDADDGCGGGCGDDGGGTQIFYTSTNVPLLCVWSLRDIGVLFCHCQARKPFSIIHVDSPRCSNKKEFELFSPLRSYIFRPLIEWTKYNCPFTKG